MNDALIELSFSTIYQPNFAQNRNREILNMFKLVFYRLIYSKDFEHKQSTPEIQTCHQIITIVISSFE